MKRCPRCKITKSLDDFHNLNRRGKKGKQAQCKICRRQMDIEYRSRPEIKEKQRDQRLKRKYGIGIIEYKQMLIDQNDSCAICKTQTKSRSPNKKDYWDIDHCHETGKVRGLLCNKCNQAIGLLQDDIELIQRVIIYLGGQK